MFDAAPIISHGKMRCKRLVTTYTEFAMLDKKVKVKDIRDLGSHNYLLTLSTPEQARLVRPGQFIMLKCVENVDDNPLLRRPFTIFNISRQRAQRETGRSGIAGKGRGIRNAQAGTDAPGTDARLPGPSGPRISGFGRDAQPHGTGLPDRRRSGHRPSLSAGPKPAGAKRQAGSVLWQRKCRRSGAARLFRTPGYRNFIMRRKTDLSASAD